MLRTNVSFAYSPNYAFIFPFEENFNKDAWRDWMERHWQLVVYIGIVYLVAIFGGRHLMKKRPRYELRNALAAWNATLAVFSIMGTLRTVPEFVHVLTNYGFHFSVCNRSYADFNPISGFWGCMFVLSKVPEFFDTAFIVLRKQKLIFLHWYHHLATATFLWYGYTDHSSTARWIIVMNYSVHSVMYTYYAFRALKYSVPKWISMFITMFQISQMIAGSVVFGYVFYVSINNYQCDIKKNLANLSMAIYVSYFILFLNFFIQAYVKRHDREQLARSQAVNGTVSNGHLYQTNVHSQTNGKKID